MERSFVKWMELRENFNDKIYNAREGIKNLLANMRHDPYSMVSGINQYSNSVQGNPQAVQIVYELTQLGASFLSDIRNQNLIRYNSRPQNGTMKPEVPRNGEAGYDQYLQLVSKYEERMYSVWRQLSKLSSQQIGQPPANGPYRV